jgi:hypothetical protein
LIGVPCQILAVLLWSVTLSQALYFQYRLRSQKMRIGHIAGWLEPVSQTRSFRPRWWRCLSLARGARTSAVSLLLLVFTSAIWLNLAIMITIMLMVGPGKPPNPDGPEKFLGLPNRLFIVAYGLWLMAAAWPIAH